VVRNYFLPIKNGGWKFGGWYKKWSLRIRRLGFLPGLFSRVVFLDLEMVTNETIYFEPG